MKKIRRRMQFRHLARETKIKGKGKTDFGTFCLDRKKLEP